MYVYDAKDQKFIMLNDITSFTKYEMSWDYIEEYRIYNITLKEYAKCKIKKE